MLARRQVGTALCLDLALLLFCAGMLTLMKLNAGAETIPYHFLFLALTLVYGFRVWPMLPTVVVVLAVTGSTGWVMYDHQLAGAIDSAELAEVLLMPALLIAMVWHARRRAEAQRQGEAMAEARRASIEREREFFLDTSHAIRTPVTIARGHLELLEPTLPEGLARDDVGVALRQLDRMASLSNRLLALAQLDAGLALRPEPLDLAAFLAEIGRNWASGADRRWIIATCEATTIRADPEWLALAVDAIVENAVHFTRPGDEITIRSGVRGEWAIVSVTDSGPGIHPADLPHIFDRFWHRSAPSGEMGSGLGLPMAVATARATGGDLTAANVSGGGAYFELTLPR